MYLCTHVSPSLRITTAHKIQTTPACTINLNLYGISPVVYLLLCNIMAVKWILRAIWLYRMYESTYRIYLYRSLANNNFSHQQKLVFYFIPVSCSGMRQQVISWKWIFSDLNCIYAYPGTFYPSFRTKRSF